MKRTKLQCLSADGSTGDFALWVWAVCGGRVSNATPSVVQQVALIWAVCYSLLPAALKELTVSPLRPQK